MTTHDEGGWHESLIAEQMDHLEREDRERLVVEYGEVLAELRRCPGAVSPIGDTTEPEPEPAVRWSPWARGQMRSCGDHTGHIESAFRLRAQRALNAEDPLWRAWHALAESRSLWEATRELEEHLLGSVAGEE
jgi:hypothetical protein